MNFKVYVSFNKVQNHIYLRYHCKRRTPFHVVLDCDILIAKAAVPGVRLSTGLGRLRGLQGQGGGPTELQVCTHTGHCNAVVVCSVTVSEFSGKLA